MQDRLYYCIGLTALFASAECVERGMDPESVPLAVADPKRKGGTICLSVSPALLKQGVGARSRVNEIPEEFGTLRVPPRVPLYVDYAARVYGALLSLFSKDDVYAYAMNEFFVDATDYLTLYGANSVALGVRILNTVREKTGLSGKIGIGSNLFLARTALDIPARTAPAGVAVLDRQTFLETLSDHSPLADFREINHRTARLLEKMGISTMRQLREAPEETLRSIFGVRTAILRDHANGVETVSLRDVKRVKARSTAMRESVDLQRDYGAEEGAEVVCALVARLAFRLRNSGLGTNSVSVYLSYGPEEAQPERGSGTATVYTVTNEENPLAAAALQAYRAIVNPDLPLRKISIYCNHVTTLPKNSSGGQSA